MTRHLGVTGASGLSYTGESSPWPPGLLYARRYLSVPPLPGGNAPVDPSSVWGELLPLTRQPRAQKSRPCLTPLPSRSSSMKWGQGPRWPL